MEIDSEVKITTHCAQHKPEGYVDVKHKVCIEINCRTRANFGPIGSKIATHCAQHKPEGYVDVKHKV
jgi:hypothetical protein